MTPEVFKIVSMMSVNGLYAILCIIIGIAAMIVGYKAFDKLTPFDTGRQLKDGNIAVAIFNGCVALGVAICSGIIIGLACN